MRAPTDMLPAERLVIEYVHKRTGNIPARSDRSINVTRHPIRRLLHNFVNPAEAGFQRGLGGIRKLATKSVSPSPQPSPVKGEGVFLRSQQEE